MSRQEATLETLLARIITLENRVRELQERAKTPKPLALPPSAAYECLHSKLRLYLQEAELNLNDSPPTILMMFLRIHASRSFIIHKGKLHVKLKDEWKKVTLDFWRETNRIVQTKILSLFKNRAVDGLEVHEFLASLTTVLNSTPSHKMLTKLSAVTRDMLT